MIRHLFTLIWNRRRANFLLIVQLFLAFVVLFVVGSLLVNTWQKYRTPLGFAYPSVWCVDLDPGTQPVAGRYATQQQIVQRLKGMPGVVAVTRSSSNTPFVESHNASTMSPTDQPGNTVNANVYELDDDARAVLGLHLQEGRWFDRRDNGSARLPVVISRDMQERLFPGEQALGKTLGREGKLQVIGIADPYRANGDLSPLKPAIFIRNGRNDTVFANLSTLLVRVRPTAGAALERQLTSAITTIGKGWNVGVTPLAEQRSLQLKTVLTPIVAVIVTCLFLIINVALGLFGVLWLNINQRRGELGVRRALGASAGAISGQVLGEIMVLTTFGLVLGLLVAMQFPLLGVFSVPAGVYLTAMALAAGGLYLLAAACALYPSRLAAGIQPAVALREE